MGLDSADKHTPTEIIVTATPVKTEAIIWSSARAVGLSADTNDRRPTTSLLRECEILSSRVIASARLLGMPEQRTSVKLQPSENISPEDLEKLTKFYQRFAEDLVRLGFLVA